MADSSSSAIIESSKDVIIVPRREDVKDYQPKEVYMNRLSLLETPRERLKSLFISFIDFRNEPTHEAAMIRDMAICGAMIGTFVGGLFRSKDAHEKYIRMHNADVFDNKYHGNRHFWDTLITGVVSKGLKYGFLVTLLTTSTGIIGFGSIAYRNQLYLPDFMIGFATLGALSRLTLGTRGILAGAGLGLAAGLFGYGFGRTLELVSGRSVTQMRLENHSQWLMRREAKLRNIQTYRDGIRDDMLDD